MTVQTRAATTAERVAELLAAAPPITSAQRDAVVRILARVPARPHRRLAARQTAA